VQVLRVDWPVYPRRAEHNTVAEGGNRRWAETALRPLGLSSWQAQKKTAFYLYNNAGSEQCIAASTMASCPEKREISAPFPCGSLAKPAIPCRRDVRQTPAPRESQRARSGPRLAQHWGVP
jgi:hypothetical protein